MADNTGIKTCTAALTGGGTADTFTLSVKGAGRLELFHHGDVDEVAYYRTDGVAPVAAADECRSLGPGERMTIPVRGDNDAPVVGLVAETGSPTITVESW